MLSFHSRHLTTCILVVAAVVLGGVVLLGSPDASATSPAFPQESCCCLVNPVDQPPYALFGRPGDLQRKADLSGSASDLPRRFGLPAPRALWEQRMDDAGIAAQPPVFPLA